MTPLCMASKRAPRGSEDPAGCEAEVNKGDKTVDSVHGLLERAPGDSEDPAAAEAEVNGAMLKV